ncbi:MAG: LppX_LprAFG lipoprotein [Thermomicrobiales bacterium]
MNRNHPKPAGAARVVACGVALIVALITTGLPGTRGITAQDDDARAVLTNAAQAMADVTSFHFELTTEGGTTTILEEFELGAVEGDVVRPDRFRAKVTAKFSIVSLDLDVVGVGDRLWVTDPTSSDGGLIEISLTDTEGEPLIDLLNPDRLLLQAVEMVENPTIAGTEEIDGVETTRIEGTFDPSTLDMEIATPAPVALDLNPKPVAIWIDGEGRVVRLRLEGPLTDVEEPEIVRTLHLSDFDAEVEITPPAGA